MGDWSSKTRNVKSTRDKRHDEPRDKRHLSPHQKPRVYRLTVKYTRTFTDTCVKEFHTKASMQAFRAGVEREIAKEKAIPPRRTSHYWGHWWNSPYKMEGIEHNQFKTGPDFTEEMIDE